LALINNVQFHKEISMHKLKKFVGHLTTFAATTFATVGAAVAQTAPAAPTTAVELAQSVDLSEAKAAGLIVVGLLITLGVVLWAARLVMSKFRPKL
jgi:hypothetical protein